MKNNHKNVLKILSQSLWNFKNDFIVLVIIKEYEYF